MEDLFIVVPKSVTLEDFRAVLGRTWQLEEGRRQPSVRLDLYRGAYITEVDPKDSDDPPFFRPGEQEKLPVPIGDVRVYNLRYQSPQLAREMARALAASELGGAPMLIDADGTYLTAHDFLRRLDEEPAWDWFANPGDAT